MATTTNDLIASIKSRGLVPASQNTISDSDILRYLNEELQNHITAEIFRYSEEYLLAKQMINIAGADTFRLPIRAYAGKVRDVVYVTPDGRRQFLPRLAREDEPVYSYLNSGRPYAFFLEGMNIRLVGATDAEGFVEITYFQRPGTLVMLSSARSITAVNADTKKVAYNAAADFITSNTKLDIISADWPSELPINSERPVLLSAFTKTITFRDVSQVNVGDYIVAAGTSPLVQIPTELEPMLVERVAMRVYKSLGDQQGVTNSLQSLQEMEKSLKEIISSRIPGKPLVLVNEHSPMKRGWRMHWRAR